MKELLKKSICLLAAALLALSAAACGQEDDGPSKDRETPRDSWPWNDRGDETEPGGEPAEPDDSGAEEPDDSGAAGPGGGEGGDATEPEDVEYLRPVGTQDGLYWGTNQNTPGLIVMNARGQVVFTLPEGVGFDAGDLGVPAFYRGFGILDNGTIIDKTGNTLFDLAASGFDGIHFMECLDVGYILCSKEVNTFDETGTHYFAVSVSDGSSFEVAFEDMDPIMTGSAWNYMGNGYFLYAPPHSGFGGPHSVYNLLTGQLYPCELTTAEGEVTDNMVDAHFLDCAFHVYGSEFRYMDDNSYVNSWVYGTYDLSTGKAAEVFAGQGTDYERVTVGQEFAGDVAVVYGIDAEGGRHPMLFDYETERFIPAEGYASLEVIAKSGDGLYLLYVSNEGGGTFVTVIGEDGNRLFEPINATAKPSPQGDYFILINDDRVAVYDWHGNLKADNIPTSRFVPGGHTLFYSVLDSENRDTGYLLDMETGETVTLDRDVICDYADVIGYSDGYYLIDPRDVFGGALMDENGDFLYLTL